MGQNSFKDHQPIYKRNVVLTMYLNFHWKKKILSIEYPVAFNTRGLVFLNNFYSLLIYFYRRILYVAKGKR